MGMYRVINEEEAHENHEASVYMKNEINSMYL